MINPSLLEDGFGTVPDRTLRQFAGILVGLFGVLFALSWYRHTGVPTRAAWIGLAIALGLGVPGLFRPAVVAPVFMGSMALTRPIGHAVSFVLLGLLYYGLVTPLATVFRLAGRDALVRRRPDSQSYWSTKTRPADVTRYLRQYQPQ
jgi:hypothetical protein